MKRLIFSIFIIGFIGGLFADELNVHLSSNNDVVLSFLRRMFAVKRTDEKVNTKLDLNVDIVVKGNEKPSTVQHHQHSNPCNACIQIVSLYEMALNRSNPVVAVQKVFIGTCDILKPRIRSLCIKFYQGQGLQAIKDVLKGVSPKKICLNLNFCRNQTELSEFENVLEGMHWVLRHIPTKNDICKDCVKMTKFLENVLDSSKSLDFIIKKMATMCTIYKTVYQDSCKNSYKNPGVLQYYKAVLAHQCPFKICQNAGACPKKDRNDVVKSNVPGEDIALCKLCRQVANIYDGLTTHKRTMGTIISASDKVCNYLPARFQKQCLHFVKVHRDDILEKMLSGVNGDQLCSQMKVCSVVENSAGRGVIGVSIVCETVSSVVYELVGDTKTDSKIKEVLNNVCGKLPEFLRKDCANFLKDDSSQIGKYIIEGVPRQLICEKLDGHKKIMATKDTMRSTDIQCALCEEIMKELGLLISKNANKADIEKALGKVCSLVRGIWRKECEIFLDKFVDKIFEYLVAGVLPEKICAMINMCDTKEISSIDTKYFLPKFIL